MFCWENIRQYTIRNSYNFDTDYKKLYIAFPESNFEFSDDILCNYHGMVYAASSFKDCLKIICENIDVVHVVIAHVNVKNMGYMPLLNSTNDVPDVYVNDKQNPTIYMVQHRDIHPETGWILKNTRDHICNSSVLNTK